MIRVLRYESCFGFADEQGDIFSVIVILSVTEGKGHARKMMEMINALPFKEIRLFPVESNAIHHLAQELGFKPVNYTKDEGIENRPDWEYIDRVSHEFGEKMHMTTPFSYPELKMNPRPDIIGYRKIRT